MVNSSLDERKQKQKIRKIGLLSLSIIITAVILIAETYAWFVGLSTVSVSDMQIKISSADGLELSLDANTWQSSTLTISQQAITTSLNSSYNKHKNKWPTSGLVPISTSGDISSPTGVLKIFGKGSLASTAGGYRIISSLISNASGSTIAEGEGYVAFDLFIRNGSNSSLYNAVDYTDSMGESIYLSTNSSVSVSAAGSQTNNGIANSVRVAFARVGMVSGSSSASVAQGITCADATGVTPLCSIASTVIWEPNDKTHDTDLISYYNRACKARTAATSYSGSCGTLDNNTFFPTYTVKKAITASDDVNIYDGAQLNTYTASITNGFLQETDTFTDTEKNVSGDARPVFFNIAANSITKVRVYIYLEGQDVDNYDLITKGQSIDINFGFTKDKFNVNA